MTEKGAPIVGNIITSENSLNLPMFTVCCIGSVERDLEAMELHFSSVASISDVLGMSPILDILYHMIFRMIWIFRGASVISLGRLMAYCHILVFVLLKF